MSYISMLSNSFTASANKTPNRKTATARNPEGADLRIFKNGSVFPSTSLTERFSLEYRSRDDENQGNGFDVIDSRTFGNTANNAVPFVMIASVPKKEGKVDLFNACTYNEDGTPNTSVLTQGATSFGKQLLSMLTSVYNLDTELLAKQGYLDVNLENVPEISESLRKATNGIYYVPKQITRGDRAGTTQVVKRENLNISILIPVAIESLIRTAGAADLTSDATANGPAKETVTEQVH